MMMGKYLRIIDKRKSYRGISQNNTRGMLRMLEIFFQAIIGGNIIGRAGRKEERNKQYEI